MKLLQHIFKELNEVILRQTFNRAHVIVEDIVTLFKVLFVYLLRWHSLRIHSKTSIQFTTVAVMLFEFLDFAFTLMGKKLKLLLLTTEILHSVHNDLVNIYNHSKSIVYSLGRRRTLRNQWHLVWRRRLLMLAWVSELFQLIILDLLRVFLRYTSKELVILLSPIAVITHSR
jgi:hypothetical protein